MNNVSRILQAIFWSIILLLISPSKATAIAYGILILGLLVAIMVTLGIVRVLITAIKMIFR